MNSLPIIFRVTLLLAFLVLFVRIIDIAILRGSYYSSLSRENRIRRIPIIAPRGIIFDRNGVPLSQNLDSKRLVRFREGKAAYFVDVGDSGGDFDSDVEIPFPRRSYSKTSDSAHVVGYVGEVDSEEVGSQGCSNSIFRLGDSIGRMGAEASFDCTLRGRDGEELVEVDIKGKRVRTLGKVEPVAGKDIFLSIEEKLEDRATRALTGRRGAVVALNPKTNEVLALVSSPSFDPNKISSEYKALSENPDLPLFNRALGGAYPPGSTFKIIVSAAGLETGSIDENFKFTDPGVIKLGAHEFTNWLFTKRGRTEGEIGIVRAITRSTDTFFYKLGEMVGVDRLALWAQKFGLGKRTGIDLGGEVSGVVPTPEWKERVRGERWFLGNTYNMAIGQGDITASPLQVALMTSVIASSGKLCVPNILKNPASQNNQISNFKFQIENCRDVGLSDKTLNLIRQGMVGACSPGGTAWPLFNFKVKDWEIPLACKTGTAEFGGKDKNGKTKAHAWLTAYAPADNPEIVVTALVEGGGEGSDVAAPIVKEVLEEWFVNK